MKAMNAMLAEYPFVAVVLFPLSAFQSSKKALIRHLIATLPSEYQSIAKLDTIRFRSLQLATPAFTNDGRDTVTNTRSHPHNADDDDEEEEEEEEDKPDNHARKRARRWKSGEVDSNTDGSKKKKIQFLTAAQKKKIGAIKGQVHEKASSCIAYVVWDVVDVVKKQVGGDDDGGDKTSSKEKKKKNKEKEKDDLSKTTPQEIASLIVKYGNNTVFEGFTLRLDHVKGSISPLPVNDENANEDSSSKTQRELALERKARLEEEKRTLYIGSLDFEEKEQSIRELCENLIIEERGQPPKNDDETKEAWVERVRLVRDPETGLGKGFAYVMFKVG